MRASIDTNVLIHLYRAGKETSQDSIEIFNLINGISGLNWNLKSHLVRFIKRFWREPYQQQDMDWIKLYCKIKLLVPSITAPSIVC